MLKKLFLILICLTGSVKQILGQITVHPYGPKMCVSLCHSYKGCLSTNFDEEHLSCQIIAKTPTLNGNCNISTYRDAVGYTVSPTKSMRKGWNISGSRHQEKGERGACSSVEFKSFMEACETGNLLEVKRVVYQGLVDVNCPREDGATAIMVASMNKSTEIVNVLVQHKCDLSARDDNGSCVLHYACYGGDEDIVRKLLDNHNSDMECRNKNGRTPLVFAVSMGRKAVVTLLRTRGADMKTVDFYNCNILHIASQNGHVDIVRYILTLTILGIDSRDDLGRTPLMTAVYCGHISVVNVLLQHSANVGGMDNFGFNVIHIACHGAQLVMVKYLVSLKQLKGFESMVDIYGRTPSEFAEQMGRSDIVTFLKSRIK